MRSRSLLVLGVLSICLTATTTSRAGLLTDYNLVVIGNRSGSSEVEGRVLIGGNATGTITNVGFNGGNLGNASLIDSLTVLGNLNASGSVQSGRIRVVGNDNGRLNNNTGNSTGVFLDTTTPVPTRASIRTELQNDSTAFGKLSTSSNAGTFTAPSNFNGGDLYFNGHPDANGLTVFTIDASLLNSSSPGSGHNLHLVANGATGVIVNVIGSLANVVDNITMNGDFSNLQSHVLFNFENATSLTIGNQFFGTILAPYADFNGDDADVNGGVFVNQLEQRNEIHESVYAGFVPSLTPVSPGVAVPEPTTLISAALGLAGVAVLAIRRRRTS